MPAATFSPPTPGARPGSEDENVVPVWADGSAVTGQTYFSARLVQSLKYVRWKIAASLLIFGPKNCGTCSEP